MTPRFRAPLAMLAGLLATAFAQPVLAAGEPCYNDDDCPGGGLACGGDVCNWHKSHPNATADKPFTCNPAGTDAKGVDGWCTDNTDCKCASLGATCVSPYCSFTKPSDAPAGSGGTASGGGSGGAAPTAGTSSTTAGTTSTAGTTAAGGSSAAGSASTPAAAEDSGCSVSAPGLANSGLAAGVAVLGLGLAFARRRR